MSSIPGTFSSLNFEFTRRVASFASALDSSRSVPPTDCAAFQMASVIFSMSNGTTRPSRFFIFETL
ncbi:Uncharacterised protein [uncultured archaeon]|nr:Uncharacterised protein [uncultured archaeon]